MWHLSASNGVLSLFWRAWCFTFQRETTAGVILGQRGSHHPGNGPGQRCHTIRHPQGPQILSSEPAGSGSYTRKRHVRSRLSRRGVSLEGFDRRTGWASTGLQQQQQGPGTPGALRGLQIRRGKGGETRTVVVLSLSYEGLQTFSAVLSLPPDVWPLTDDGNLRCCQLRTSQTKRIPSKRRGAPLWPRQQPVLWLVVGSHHGERWLAGGENFKPIGDVVRAELGQASRIDSRHAGKQNNTYQNHNYLFCLGFVFRAIRSHIAKTFIYIKAIGTYQ